MAVHIIGKRIKGKLPVQIALSTKIYGLSRAQAQEICAKLGFYPAMRMHELTEDQIVKLGAELSNYKIEGEARQIVRDNIMRKFTIGSYQGLRHAYGYPVRGRGTNASTAAKLNRLERRGFSTSASPIVTEALKAWKPAV